LIESALELRSGVSQLGPRRGKVFQRLLVE
jgi:hypothetical protein